LETEKEYLVDSLSPREYIIIKCARVNNLKNLSVAIPRNKLIVITGLSGSGKSSLAFDTLFAEGQRMYVESLSAYARQFLGRMEKPDVDYIIGVSPAIAIEQKVNTRNVRSTVGTSTEIYDYIKLLYSRIGKTYSPMSGKEVTQHTVTDVVDALNLEPKGTKIIVACPLRGEKGRKLEEELKLLSSKGYNRVLIEGKTAYIEDILDGTFPDSNKKSKNTFPFSKNSVEILIDRTTTDPNNEDFNFRISDSVHTAFYEGGGDCIIYRDNKSKLHFSDRFELDGITFTKPSINFFGFNNSFGACQNCEGFGKVLGIDDSLVIPDKSLSLYENAVAPWRTESMSRWRSQWLKIAANYDFPIHKPYNELTEPQRQLLWHGNRDLSGIYSFFEYLKSKSHKIQYRVLLSRYQGKTTCPSCQGTRLRKDAANVKICGMSIIDLVLLSINETKKFFQELKLSPFELKVSERLLIEINQRLDYLIKVGLGYLSLNRMTNTLSGGEYQRIKLATSLGSALVGSMYILDEPSIGLHPKDTEKMIEVLKSLRDLGNTVIVVEHEEEIMRSADEIIDIGPDAGQNGGCLVFQGNHEDITQEVNTHTTNYLSGKDIIGIPKKRRKWKDSVTIVGARENNLKNITVKFPLKTLIVVSGVSGSGKTTLIKNILYPALGRMSGNVFERPGEHDKLTGDVSTVTQVELIDQNPIGKSSRSNPISYMKVYDLIRQLYATQPLSVQRGYKSTHFSFNVDGGRCENCQGDGKIKVEMQFMADIYLTCEECKGKRFKQEILEVEFKSKSILDILEMTVEEALTFFSKNRKIIEKISPLSTVGLDYIKLGQSSNSLSGGEAQRLKLASFIGKNSSQGHILFIFDEPTTGLHFHDISKLLKALNALVDNGHSVIVIEHNLEIIKCADWIIDLGPEGGEENGGNVVFEGTPEEMLLTNESYTAKYLKTKIQ